MPPKGSPEWWDLLGRDFEEDHRAEGQAFALDPVQGNRHVRRWGLHPGGMVGRLGDLYYKSKAVAVGHILPVIMARLSLLRAKGLPDTAYLPFPEQNAIQKSFYESRRQSGDGVKSRKRCELRSSRREDLERNMKSQ